MNGKCIDAAMLLLKNGGDAETAAQLADGVYPGADLTQRFAAEIAADPYDGNPWAWIKGRIAAGNFAGVHVGDYIPFTTANSVNLNAEIAGINTYRGTGDPEVGNHIDFVCQELWPTFKPFNPVNLNNGTRFGSAAANEHPWLASDLYLYLNSLSGTAPSEAAVGGGSGTAVDYTSDGVYDKLPEALRNVIIEKRAYLAKRYSGSGLLTDDNSVDWKNLGKLWLPTEYEVYGAPCWGGKGANSYAGCNVQYPLFRSMGKRVKKRSGSRYHWWLMSTAAGNSTSWCRVYFAGTASSAAASSTSVAAPVCFRIG